MDGQRKKEKEVYIKLKRVSAFHQVSTMRCIYLAYTNLLISLAGTLANFLALYCSWRTMRGSILSNSDKLALVLNIADAIYCAVLLPMKIIYYFLNPQNHVRGTPIHLAYIDAFNICFTSFLITLIAFNRYIMISKASKHHLILPRRRLHKLMFLILVVSL